MAELASSPTEKTTLSARVKNLWHRLIALESSPRAIALGTSVGIFVAFSPTVGLHMLLAAALATALRANPIPAAAMAWITNPITIAPIFTLTYKIGIVFWTPRSHLGVEEQLKRLLYQLTHRSETLSVTDSLHEIMRLGSDFLMPLLIGGAMLGLALAALSYPIVLWAVVRARQSIAWKRYLRTQHRKE